MTEILDESVRATLLGPLFDTGWEVERDGDVLVKTFTFADFTEAFAFMTRPPSGRRSGTTTRTGAMSTRRSLCA